MLRYLLLLFLLPALLSAQEELTDAEKETLLSKVEGLEQSVITDHEKTQVDVVGVFDEALKSEKKTYELFELCRKKVVFMEEKREDKDARDSERYMDDALSDEFKRALLHQLYFLRHSLEAKHNPERRMMVAKRLVDGLGQIVKDEDSLNYEMIFNKEVPGYAADSDKHRSRIQQSRMQKNVLGGKVYSPLHQDPFQSVFAKAYKVDHLRPEGWMAYPLDFNGLYDGIILSGLIEEGDFSSAREQWKTRIKGEVVLHSEHGIEPSKRGDTPASYDKFLEVSVPELQWQAEQRFFTEGDEKEAAENLYTLLNKHGDHPKYLEWVKWFKQALK